MAKQTKKPVSKVVVGNTKSKKGLSLTKRTALFGLVGIMAFSIIAGFGMQKWQDHQLTAKAANYGTYIGKTSGVSFYACKVQLPLGQYRIYIKAFGNPYPSSLKYLSGSSGTFNGPSSSFVEQWRETTVWSGNIASKVAYIDGVIRKGGYFTTYLTDVSSSYSGNSYEYTPRGVQSKYTSYQGVFTALDVTTTC